MAGDPVEIVRRQFEHWNEGTLEDIRDIYTEDVYVVALEGWPEGPSTTGVDAWMAQSVRLRDDWDEARADVEEVREVSPGRVFARMRYVTSKKEGGLSFNIPIGIAFFFAEGRIDQFHYFWNADDALAMLEAGPSPREDRG